MESHLQLRFHAAESSNPTKARRAQVRFTAVPLALAAILVCLGASPFIPSAAALHSATTYAFHGGSTTCWLTVDRSTTYHGNLSDYTVNWNASLGCNGNVGSIFLRSSLWDDTGQGYRYGTGPDRSCTDCTGASSGQSAELPFREYDVKTNIQLKCADLCWDYRGIWTYGAGYTASSGSATPMTGMPVCVV